MNSSKVEAVRSKLSGAALRNFDSRCKELELEATMKRIKCRALKAAAKRTGMTVRWVDHKIVGFDRKKSAWVTVYNGLL